MDDYNNPILTQAEEEAIIAAARESFAEKGYVAGPIYTSPNFTFFPTHVVFKGEIKGMYLTFEAAPECTSGYGSMDIYITSDFEVLSYEIII